MQHGLAPTSAQDGPAEKDGGTQGGRLAIAALWGSLALIKTQQVEAQQHRQKRRFSGPEVLGAEIIGGQIVLELLNPLLDGGPPIVIAPQDHRLLSAVGHPDAKGVARHVQELASHGGFVFAHPLPHHHEAPLLGPAQ